MAESKTNNRQMWAVLFLSLVLDLIAFSAYLPLLPRIMDHYNSASSGQEDILYQWLHSVADRAQAIGPASSGSFQAKVTPTPTNVFNVVMGGAVFSVFSIVQFICMPILGCLSDSVGRKPVMLLSLVGTTVSYLTWASANSFSMFVSFKIVQGALKGNVHVAQSIVTDSTTEVNRSKGMALIGMAYTVAFIVGPMASGILLANDLLPSHPALPNPYSGVALTCAGLSF
eukprot:gene4400-4656_t